MVKRMHYGINDRVCKEKKKISSLFLLYSVYSVIGLRAGFNGVKHIKDTESDKLQNLSQTRILLPVFF